MYCVARLYASPFLTISQASDGARIEGPSVAKSDTEAKDIIYRLEKPKHEQSAMRRPTGVGFAQLEY